MEEGTVAEVVLGCDADDAVSGFQLRHGVWTGLALLLIVSLLVSGASELVRDELARLTH
jgi:hypothetical protein